MDGMILSPEAKRRMQDRESGDEIDFRAEDQESSEDEFAPDGGAIDTEELAGGKQVRQEFCQ